jgi:acyl-coenzyme A thioesterase PaaI-like protein
MSWFPRQENGILVLPFAPNIVGSPHTGAIHGGVTGALLETGAMIEIARHRD